MLGVDVSTVLPFFQALDLKAGLQALKVLALSDLKAWSSELDYYKSRFAWRNNSPW